MSITSSGGKIIIFAATFFCLWSFVHNGYIPIMNDPKETTINIKYMNGTCAVEKDGNNLWSVDGSEKNSEAKRVCKKGFTSREVDGIVKCCYAQKDKISAFLLETFIGFGAGHYYVGNNTLFIIKVVVYTFIFLSVFIVLVISCIKKDRFNFSLSFIRSGCILISGCTYIGWQIVDGVLFMLGGYTDSNGVSLS